MRIRTALRPAAPRKRRRRRRQADRGPVDEIYEFRLGLSSGGDAQVNTFGETHFFRAEELKFGGFFVRLPRIRGCFRLSCIGLLQVSDPGSVLVPRGSGCWNY